MLVNSTTEPLADGTPLIWCAMAVASPSRSRAAATVLWLREKLHSPIVRPYRQATNSAREATAHGIDDVRWAVERHGSESSKAIKGDHGR